MPDNFVQQHTTAIMSTFPTIESFTEFCSHIDNSSIVDSFIGFAARNRVIDSAELESLEQWVLHNTVSNICPASPQKITFEELLNKKGETLRLNLSLRALCTRINTVLDSQHITLPRVTNSMLIRLKKEPLDTAHKRNVLRSFAFWMGFERPDIAATWHFESLAKLFREGRPARNYTEGARIGFALSSRGDVIDHEVVGWLKKAIKEYIGQSINRFLYGKWGKVKAHDIMTLYVDFPKEEKGGNLVYYRNCMQSAVMLAHQISLRWALSKFATKNRFLSIAIVAGEYANLDNYLLQLLSTRLPGDPVIRLSDYARQCLLINDIRAILCPNPAETTLFNGESLHVWWITGLWTTLYFEFISELLDDEVLQNTPSSIEKLDRLLWPISEGDEAPSGTQSEDHAIATFFKSPHNSMLGVEIAKTLYYRKRCAEAAEILRIVLSINPMDLVARTLRMILFRNMALDTPSYRTAAAIFRQAEQEADNIQKHCDCHSEDFYCEYGILCLAEALSIVRHLRASLELASHMNEMEKMKQAVYAALERSKYFFEKGISLSPSGTRSSYLLKSAAIVKAIFENDEELFINPGKPLTAEAHVGQKESMDVQWQVGYRRSDLPIHKQDELAETTMIHNATIHGESIVLLGYQPAAHFCYAVALWDFLSPHTVSRARIVRDKIQSALETAQQAQEKNVYIYSFTRIYGEMIPPGEFIEHMKRAMQMINEEVGGDLEGRQDDEIITSEKRRPPKLFTLNF